MNSEKIKCDLCCEYKTKIKKKDKCVKIWTYVFKTNLSDLVGQCLLGVYYVPGTSLSAFPKWSCLILPTTFLRGKKC